ncbi:MAG: cell division protein FtsZ [Flavobacteriales bacterium]|nr:cell division protein FtsZ [Flavobacteriales bacterium]MCW8913855.1 cell division protein FtsZ [Flavobacteriales bacterium]MCW8937971.1 cell division protein FtsZ [Flavobacteriales bacterium]MCW8940215.1 cell division protein FtsZ [Flavobacteriales bacterium]MCW8968404.1 cell division protein FtsZ [Flavobacteriales bacterium]
MKFNLPKDQASIIKVIGVGGGGSNAVNHMYNQGITGVDFIICNTDAQALDLSPIPNKIQLGTTLTEGLGAGANPEVGKNAAIEDIDNIKKILENNTKMVFITAGMGGGTGTGAAPIIAKTAREMGILTVGIVTIPFSFEGRRRKQQAEEGLEQLRQNVDTLLIINNDKLRMMHGNLKMGEAFSKADDILTIAAKGIAEIITVAGYINVDFEDVKTVMKDGGTAIMGSATAEGDNRAIEAVTKAISSPLLNDNEIEGANYILLNITSGEDEITMDEIDDITDYIQNEAGYTAELIWGNGLDESLGSKVSVTVIATGFGKKELGKIDDISKSDDHVVHTLDTEENITNEVTPEVTDNLAEDEAQDEPYISSSNQSAFEFNDVFSNEENETVSEENDKDAIVFGLDDDMEEIEEKQSVIMEEEQENKNHQEEDKEDNDFFVSDNNNIEAEQDENSIVWNLNDDEDADINESKQTTTFSGEQHLEEEDEKSSLVYSAKIPDEDQLKRNNERIMRIRELGMKMKTSSGLSELEKEPAYKRRKINLKDTPHSSESSVSRFTLSDDEEGKPKLKDGNSFLHDNVD